jgi:spore maturation protein CgeB
MIAAGWSPSVRLFEAAACGTPIISDPWPGLETILRPGKELLVAATALEVREYIRSLPEGERRAIGDRARRRVLASHTAAHRAAELEGYVLELQARRPAA